LVGGQVEVPEALEELNEVLSRAFQCSGIVGKAADIACGEDSGWGFRRRRLENSTLNNATVVV
jgi:hypothetical protein